jgi:3-oxoacyl-[acyl-carrier protein] reductase
VRHRHRHRRRDACREAGVSRVAVVTGGASGIGRATAELLAGQGVSVAVFDRAGDTPVDVSDPVSVERAVEEVRRTLGPVDIVVNAAGISAREPVTSASFVESWQQVIGVNLTGTMNVVRACLDDLLRSEAGRIVNIASTEALAAGRGLGAYAASKSGVVGFTRSLAVDLGRGGVTANCVCPGATLTGMTQSIPAAEREVYAKRGIPVGRYGRPEEIAYMIVALTSRDASFVNGAIIPVDGGMTAQSK